MIRVSAVAPDSLGAELGLRPGTELLSVNGRELGDFLDWEFLTADDQFLLLARFGEGELVEFDVERPDDLPMGVRLEAPRIRRCANHCDFCFVDGLPSGLRETLYIRDDDYRLSFRYGNFATLTNLKPKDIERILEYHLSPLYVSVHATDPVIRRRVLRNPRAPDVLEQISMFARGGIQFHTQIVLQPGVNDGAVLEHSLEDLYLLGDAVLSAAVVPVGLTSFSDHGASRQPSREECHAAVSVVQEFWTRSLAARERRWVHGSDELYLVAGLELPPAEAYEGFDQVENGVGSVRYLQQRIAAEADALPNLTDKRVAVLTGTGMARLMPRVLETLAHHTGGTFQVVVLENDLFGPSVTTAGLLPGRVFQRALEAATAVDLALLPAEAVNDDGLFLDDLPLADLRARIPIEIRTSYDFIDALAGTADS